MSSPRPFSLFVLSLGILLTACKPQAAPTPVPSQTAAAQPVGDASPSPPAAAAADTCPAEDFEAFLKRFGHEIPVQEASVSDPLVSERYDPDAQPEPRLITEKVALKDVTWPVMPDPASFPRQGRTLQIAKQPDGSMKVLVSTPDTSDQQSYYFARRPCWKLVRMVDESI